MTKPTIAVHKFSSCDGCQLAFLNMGEALLTLFEKLDVKHFAEAGPVDQHAKVDIAFVEGSVSTKDELERINMVRANSKYLITIGACATAGGIQALRNGKDHKAWMSAIYAKPEFIDSLSTSTAIAKHVKVDYEIWGCPINSEQVIEVVNSLLFGVTPTHKKDSVCVECKRQGHVCVLVTQNEPCLGPVTQTGCGALCPSVGRGCFGCYGPQENPNAASLANRFAGFGLMPAEIARRYLFINNQAPAFKVEGERQLKKLEEKS